MTTNQQPPGLEPDCAKEPRAPSYNQFSLGLETGGEGIEPP